jgi:CheY-like chemotaxis protein
MRGVVKASKGIRILLIEDLKSYQFVIQAHLQDFPCRLDIAESAAEVAEKFMSCSYDLVLLDLDILFLDGDALATDIRKWERDRSLRTTPIIALADHTSGRYGGAHSIHASGVAYLSKPLTAITLVTEIWKIIQSFVVSIPVDWRTARSSALE